MDATSPAIVAIKKAQLETRIHELKQLMLQYNNKISYYNGQIKSADKSYESITRFKRSVQSSHEDFADISKGKTSALEQVNLVSTNNIVAKRYYSGMKCILLGTGAKITTKLYQFLLSKIQIEQTALRNKANDSSDQVTYYTRLLNSAQTEYNAKVQELRSL